MTFAGSIKTCLDDKYATFNGRASRSEHWWFVLFNGLVCWVGVTVIALLVAGIVATFIPTTTQYAGINNLLDVIFQTNPGLAKKGWTPETFRENFYGMNSTQRADSAKKFADVVQRRVTQKSTLQQVKNRFGVDEYVDTITNRTTFKKLQLTLYVVCFVLTILPLLAVATRRLHDTGRSGWCQLVPLLFDIVAVGFIGYAALIGGGIDEFAVGIGIIFAVAGRILLTVWLVTKGDLKKNKYGPPTTKAKRKIKTT